MERKKQDSSMEGGKNNSSMKEKKNNSSVAEADRSLLDVSPSAQLSNIAESSSAKGLTASGKKKKLSVDAQISMSYLSEESDTGESEEDVPEKEDEGVPVIKKRKEEDKDLSIVNKMTEEEMKDHVSCCLKLSNENKISSKNAFALKLIDCMTQLAKKEDDKNFTALACQLDAGAKIYSHRVDAVHHQVIKLAESCVYAERNPKKDGKNNAEENDGMENKDNKEEKKKKKNKKRVLVPPEQLTRKLKGKDPRCNFIRLSARPGEILMKAKRDPVTFALTLENNTPFWPWQQPTQASKADDVCELPEMDLSFMRTRRIGPVLKEIDEERTRLSILAQLERSQQPSTSVAGDVDYTKDETDKYSNDDDDDAMGSDHFAEAEYEVPDTPAPPPQDNEVEVISVARERMRKELGRDPSRLEVMKAIFHNAGESEYHYLRMANSRLWAGPSYWKRPQVAADAVANKKKVVRVKREPIEIKYDEAAETSLNRRWSSGPKRNTTVSQKTLANWNQKKVTLPPDIQFNLDTFNMLFCFDTPAQLFIRQPKGSDSPVKEENDENDEHFDNFEELSEITIFADSEPQNTDDSDKTQIDLKSEYPTPPTTDSDSDPSVLGKELQNTIDTYEGDNLVPMVKVVKVEPIKYTTRPNRVDMKHLKEVMLSIIEREIKDKENRASGGKDSIAFKDVLKELYRTPALHARTKQDLTVAMAFLCLLTLTNEQSFTLIQEGEVEDVIIMLDSSPNQVTHRNRFDI